MFVVRPHSIHGTPSSVAHDLGAPWRTKFYPNPLHPRRYDYNRDFLMMPVAPNEVVNAPPDYVSVYQFSHKNKFGQRSELQRLGVPVPCVASTPGGAAELSGERFVVRPLRHTRSVGYRVTANRLDFSPGTEYISELYPKRREYRIIFVFGNPLIVLRKKPHEGVSDADPWGHVNSSFQTINDVPGSRIGGTNALSLLSAIPVVAGSHIVAADLLHNSRDRKPWVCLELNFCPSLEIDNNRAKVVEAIRARVH